MLLSNSKPMCYFLPPENFRKGYSFLKFSGGKNGTLWVSFDMGKICHSL